MLILRHTPFSPEAERLALEGAIRELEWKIERLSYKHPAYVEATRPELEARLAERCARLERTA